MTYKGRKEFKKILDLQKIRPATKPIRLSLKHKNIRDAKRAQLQTKPRKSGLIVSIPLTDGKVEKPAITPSQNADCTKMDNIGVTCNTDLNQVYLIQQEQESLKQAELS